MYPREKRNHLIVVSRAPVPLTRTAIHVQVLSQLGVWILDAPALGNQARNRMVLEYANACSPTGVLNALQQALFPSASPPPPRATHYGDSPSSATAAPALPESAAGAEQRDFGPGGAARRRVDNRFQSVAPPERDTLRRFLSGLQRTGAQLTAQQTELLKGLPIYRVHGDGAPGGQFTSISGAERLLLAPRSTDPDLLGAAFAVEERGDTELLESLGVERVGKGVFFREHVLPRAVLPRAVLPRAVLPRDAQPRGVERGLSAGESSRLANQPLRLPRWSRVALALHASFKCLHRWEARLELRVVQD